MAVAIQTKTVREGSTKLVVPEQDEPVKFPTFFNPKGEYVRDISIVCYNAFASSRKGTLVFADSLAGSGARGIRVANEAKGFSTVILNDISSTSIDLAKSSVELNNVSEKCKFSKKEVCSFLSLRAESGGERFDVLDIDPFGTPSPYIDCGLRSLKDGGLLSLSATDSGVLCGVYPRVALRKYLGFPLRTEYSHEVGMRLIFGLLAMTAMRLELSIEPLFCHHDMHYFRTYSIVHVGNSRSRQNEVEIGFILHCFKCGWRSTVSRDDVFFSKEKDSEKCPSCKSSSIRVGGPLWIGKIQSRDFVEICYKNSRMTIFEPESDLATYYDLSEMTDIMGVRTPKIMDVITNLNSAGRSASRTRLNPRAIRTDAPLPEIRSVLKELVR